MISAFFMSDAHVQATGREPRRHGEAPTRRRYGAIRRRGPAEGAWEDVAQRTLQKLAYDL